MFPPEERFLELTPPAEPGLQEWIGEKLARAWELAGLPGDDGLDLRFSPYLLVATTTRAIAQAPLGCVCHSGRQTSSGV